MNKIERISGRNSEKDDPQGEPSSKGPNLVLLYGLVALALAVAIGFALLIVLPFYHRR
jgi:hypothetical protein